MCCEDDGEHGPVTALLERYRALLAARGLDWGDDRPELMKALGTFAYRYEDEHMLGDLQTLPEGVEAVLGDMQRVIAADGLPPRVAIERPEGVQLPDSLPFAIADHPFDYDVFVQADGNRPATVRAVIVSAERPDLEVGGHRVRAVEVVGTGRVHLCADAVSRWTVLDERGGPWFPDGALRKYDYYGRPFFHGNDLTVDVPVGRITVSVARGCEFRPASATVEVLEGGEIAVNLSPSCIYDAASRGWYGGDLHVHMNYSGDQVCTLQDAALMQEGEGLHLMTLQAPNENTMCSVLRRRRGAISVAIPGQMNLRIGRRTPLSPRSSVNWMPPSAIPIPFKSRRLNSTHWTTSSRTTGPTSARQKRSSQMRHLDWSIPSI